VVILGDSEAKTTAELVQLCGARGISVSETQALAWC
jgi:hypothetical protein